MNLRPPQSPLPAPAATDPFLAAQQRDPRGHAVHFIMLFIIIGMLPFGTAPFAILSIIVMVYVLLRLWATCRAVGTLIHQPIFLALAALAAIHLLSLLWSRDIRAGLDELQTLRLQIPFLIAFWPHHRQARKLIWALAIGVGVMACVQLLQFAFGGPPYPMYFWWHQEVIPDRYPGMLHPNSTALIAMTALLLLPSVIGPRVSRQHNFCGIMLIIASFISLILTGSRGEWVAAAIGAATWPLAFWRMRKERRTSTRRTILASLAGVAILLTGGFFARSLVETRLNEAVSEIHNMTSNGDVSTDVGGRLNQFIISSHLIARHPFIGIGVGSYAIQARAWLESQPMKSQSSKPGADANDKPEPERIRGFLAQPHSSFLYEFDSLGLLGGIVFMALWVIMVFQCTEKQTDGRYSRMTFLPAVIGLITANALDMHWTSSPGNIVLMLVILLTMRDRYEDVPARLIVSSSIAPVSPGPGRVRQEGARL